MAKEPEGGKMNTNSKTINQLRSLAQRWRRLERAYETESRAAFGASIAQGSLLQGKTTGYGTCAADLERLMRKLEDGK